MSNKTSTTPKSTRQQPFLLVRNPETKEAATSQVAPETKEAPRLRAGAANLSGKRTRKTRATRARGRKTRAKRSGQIPSLPPPIDSVDVVPFHRRFLATGTLSFAQISRASIFTALGGIAVSVSTMNCWASSFRIRRFRAWPAAGGEVQISFWTSTGEQALMREKVAVNTMPTGITLDRGSDFAPPRSSYLAMWQSLQGTSEVLIEISCTTGAIIDMEGVYTLNTGLVQSSIALGGGTVSIGEAYYAPLDTATAKLVPQGLSKFG